MNIILQKYDKKWGGAVNGAKTEWGSLWDEND